MRLTISEQERTWLRRAGVFLRGAGLLYALGIVTIGSIGLVVTMYRALEEHRDAAEDLCAFNARLYQEITGSNPRSIWSSSIDAQLAGLNNHKVGNTTVRKVALELRDNLLVCRWEEPRILLW